MLPEDTYEKVSTLPLDPVFHSSANVLFSFTWSTARGSAGRET
jgi:hypothetical protein